MSLASDAASTPASPGGRHRVTAVVVSYNAREWLGRCLDSLPEACRQHDLEVIVLDNASADGSADMVARSSPGPASSAATRTWASAGG